MKKRILMISYHTCPLASEEGKETGGMNVYVYELSQHLAKLGHTVDVITRCQDAKEKKTVDVSRNFRVIHLTAGPQIPVVKKKLLAFVPEFVDSLENFIAEEKTTYDLLHAHYYQSGLIATEIKKKLLPSAPFLMTFHTLALMKNLVARTEEELEDEIRIQAELDISKKANVIITPSESDQQYLHLLYDVQIEKTVEIPPGVNTDVFKPLSKTEAKKYLRLSEKEKIILFVGRIEPLKGVDALLYALKILCREAPDLSIRLLIVGGDISEHHAKWSDQLRHLDQVRRLLGIADCVQFVGQKPQHELRYYYNAAEVVVMPSHYESFGMAAAEAMACGTPVITSNVTGISNLIDERRSTLITTVNNPLLLASQLKQLLTDEKIYEEVRNNIMENVEELSWERVVKQIEAVYESSSLRGIRQ